MRITFNMQTMQYLYNLNNNMNKMSEASEKVTKGMGLLNPEDNPVNYSSALNIQRTIDEATQFKSNGESALSWIKNEDSELQRAADLIIQAKNEYALAGLNDSQDATSRKALAGDVKNILDSMVDVGNANYMGRYIFGGYETQTQPFAAGEREISAVSSSVDGFDVVVKKAYGDLVEPKEGEYRAIVEKINDSTVRITIEDENGKRLFLDSNGSDETATDQGNLSATEIIAEYGPNRIVDTGLGFGIKLPESFTENRAEIDFLYKPGNDIQYHGDDGHINTKISYAQDVTINLTGKEVFMETNRILESTRINTVNNLPITPTTKFSQIDGANVMASDSIEINGTDHNGLNVGVAKISGERIVALDLSNASKENRTVHITYAGKTYNIEADKKSYESIEDLVFDINRKLEAESGLSNEVKAIADGDRIMFYTTRAGNAVKLSVAGSENNKLGFGPDPREVSGKDTIFEFGYDNYSAEPLEITYTAGITFEDNATTTFYINNEAIKVMPVDSSVDNTGLDINEIRKAVDEALAKSDLYGKVNIDIDSASATTGITSGNATLAFNNIKISYQNESFTNDTHLATNVDDPTSAIFTYKTANPRESNYPTFTNEKDIEDLLNFIEDLYDNSVKAEIKDGKLSVTDLRPGKSKLSMQINESNAGIGYPSDSDIILMGNYTASIDDTWEVNFDGANKKYIVTNSQGTQITSGEIPDDYHGQPLDLGYGVSMVIGENTFDNVVNQDNNERFSFNLKANGSLSFGDMNIVVEGQNVDTFRSLKNLYDALNLNIAEGGIGAPSDWEDDSLNSTAKSYFEGEFRGNYNDMWTYEVQPIGQTSEFFLQKETSSHSGELNLGSSNLSFDISYYNKAENTFSSETINISPLSGNLTENELLIAINDNANLSGNGIHAEIINDKLVVYSGFGSQTVSLKANDQDTADALGIKEDYIYPQSDTSLSLADATEDQRTLTFRDSGGIIESIEVDAKDYADLDELVTELNNKITNGNIKAVNDNGKLAFENTPGNPLVVTGDKNGTLGFYEPGDSVNIKVSGNNGELINNVTLNTANKTEYIADGVRIGFDPGMLYASDSFTNTVGSGIDYELPVLDQAENQITQSLTTVGNRQIRVESVINFHTTVSTKNEEIKAGYLESAEQDLTKFITEFVQAQQAYQFAMQVASSAMQMTIMDYL